MARTPAHAIGVLADRETGELILDIILERPDLEDFVAAPDGAMWEVPPGAIAKTLTEQFGQAFRIRLSVVDDLIEFQARITPQATADGAKVTEVDKQGKVIATYAPRRH